MTQRRLRLLTFATAMLLGPTALLPAIAGPQFFSWTGTFTADDDVVLQPFTLLTESTVTAQTFAFGGGVNGVGASIASGGFGTVLSLFLTGGNQDLLALASGGAGNPDTSAFGARGDSLLTTRQPAGMYTLALTQAGNTPNGPTLADGFLEAGNPSYTGVN